ncbi:MAG: tyrosine-type recombinase/integrase, partial [Candidatus Hydrothermarchaeaceae archaeon]
NDRDRAAIALLFDVGCRPSELLRLRVKDVVIDYDTGTPTAVINLRGKTGMRRVRAFYSVPYLIMWRKHLPDEPLHPFWPQNRKGGAGYLRRDGLRKILRSATKRAGIKKKVYPYIFRHTRATIYASVMTEAQMCIFFGWRQGSKMPAVYVHLSGREVDDRLLEFYNLRRDQKTREEKLPWKCVVCGSTNPDHMEICYNCMKLRPSAKDPLGELLESRKHEIQHLMKAWKLEDPVDVLLRLLDEHNQGD